MQQSHGLYAIAKLLVVVVLIWAPSAYMSVAFLMARVAVLGHRHIIIFIEFVACIVG